jgi:hypothetical protein
LFNQPRLHYRIMLSTHSAQPVISFCWRARFPRVL